jgi:hypothetical protein
MTPTDPIVAVVDGDQLSLLTEEEVNRVLGRRRPQVDQGRLGSSVSYGSARALLAIRELAQGVGPVAEPPKPPTPRAEVTKPPVPLAKRRKLLERKLRESKGRRAGEWSVQGSWFGSRS